MNSKVAEFLQKYNDIVDKYGKFLFYSRGIEFQRYSAKKFDALMREAAILKEEMIKTNDEDAANTMLSLEYLLSAHIDELRMIAALKEDRIDDAWKSLVQAQYSLRFSLQASNIVLSLGAQNHMNRLLSLERTIFPSQTYSSIGAIVEEAKCSICNQEYGACSHIIGRPYMGKLCYRIITKIKDVKEVSLVWGEPGNKLCRVDSFADKGHWRDIMTWRVRKKQLTPKEGVQ